MEKPATGVPGVVQRTRNSLGRRATGRDVITCSASGLKLASYNALFLTNNVVLIGGVGILPDGSVREMNKEGMFSCFGVSAFRKPMRPLWCQCNPSLADVS